MCAPWTAPKKLDTNPTLGGSMGKYTEQFKLKAIAAYLDGSHGFRTVARHFGIDFSLLRRWVASHQADASIGQRPHGRRYS